MIEKGIIGAICHAIYRPAIANDKCMKNYDKNKESLYIMYLDGNNLYGGKKLPVNNFQWKKNISKINETFIKKCDENSGYII